MKPLIMSDLTVPFSAPTGPDSVLSDCLSQGVSRCLKVPQAWINMNRIAPDQCACRDRSAKITEASSRRSKLQVSDPPRLDCLSRRVTTCHNVSYYAYRMNRVLLDARLQVSGNFDRESLLAAADAPGEPSARDLCCPRAV